MPQCISLPFNLHLTLDSFIRGPLNSTLPICSPLFFCRVYGFPFVSFHLQCVARASNAPSPSGRIKVERVTCSLSNPVIQLLWPWPQCKHTPVPGPPVQITPKPHYYQSLTEMMSTANEISQQKSNTRK